MFIRLLKSKLPIFSAMKTFFENNIWNVRHHEVNFDVAFGLAFIIQNKNRLFPLPIDSRTMHIWPYLAKVGPFENIYFLRALMLVLLRDLYPLECYRLGSIHVENGISEGSRIQEAIQFHGGTNNFHFLCPHSLTPEAPQNSQCNEGYWNTLPSMDSKSCHTSFLW